jgi:hypothetical protein
MHFGIPVVLPRLKFLAQFCTGTAKTLVHDPGEVDSLVAQIARLENEAKHVESIRRNAASFVDTEYGIANSVNDIEALYRAAANG